MSDRDDNIAGVSWHPHDKPIQASERAWEQFKESAIWSDIRGFYSDLREELLRLLTDPDIAITLDKVREFQAGIRICEEMLVMPDRFIDEIRLTREHQEGEDDDARQTTI